MSEDIYYLRLKDSAGSYSFGNKSRFTPSNPYDCFAFYKSYLFPMELKSTKGTSISFQKSKKENGAMIKFHQIEGLTLADSYNNVYAGFIFDFRESDTFWMGISDFNKFLQSTTKKSINKNDIIQFNGIKINKSKKRTRYSYDIEKLFSEIIRRENWNGKGDFL